MNTLLKDELGIVNRPTEVIQVYRFDGARFEVVASYVPADGEVVILRGMGIPESMSGKAFKIRGRFTQFFIPPDDGSKDTYRGRIRVVLDLEPVGHQETD